MWFIEGVISWERGWEKQNKRVEDAKCLILPDPVGTLEYEFHHLEVWGPSTLCPLSFMPVSQSSVAGCYWEGRWAISQARKLLFRQVLLGRWKPFIANRPWEMYTLPVMVTQVRTPMASTTHKLWFLGIHYRGQKQKYHLFINFKTLVGHMENNRRHFMMPLLFATWCLANFYQTFSWNNLMPFLNSTNLYALFLIHSISHLSYPAEKPLYLPYSGKISHFLSKVQSLSAIFIKIKTFCFYGS